MCFPTAALALATQDRIDGTGVELMLGGEVFGGLAPFF